VCAGCSVGCTVDVISRDNNLVRVEGNWEGAVNSGVLCETGRFKPLDEKRTRLVTPLVRKDGTLKAATWDEAMQAIAQKLAPLAGKNGSGLAAVSSTRLPAEALYSFKQVFADGLKGSLVTTTEEGSLAKLGELAEKLSGPFETSLDALDTADLVLTVGEDLTDTHQVAGFFVKRKLSSGLKLVTIDGDANGLDTWADCAVKAGSDFDALRGIATAVVGQEEALALIAAQTGVDADSYRSIAQLLAEAEKPVFVYGKELVSKDSQGLCALLDLAKMTGAQVIGTKGGANSVAALQYRLDRPVAIQGQQAAFVLIGDEEPTERLIQKLDGVPFLVVQSSYASKLTGMADVVLPVETWLEQEGHYVSLDGRVQAAQKTLQAPPEVRSNLAVLADLAGRLGVTTDDRWQQALNERPSTVTIAA
ncbi:MAG TPA: molybdopterin-dependent oxidoreductase, partial [Anaerolineaceae bacterium]|nr:molybdopterin-dependent oxidoreductase [Anaerolineaceae bacterium]